VKLGQTVTITSQSYPGKPFTGRVSFIYPFLDPKTRTVKVRVAMPNPGLKLKPDMFVNAVIKSPLGPTLAVPATAVMDTGKRQIVWVEMQAGMFEPRDVQVGARVGDNVQIISGLAKGEKVAASGGYLIDSESQLKGGGGAHEGMPGMKMDAPKGAAPAAPAPAPKKGGALDMGDMKM
jgi:membrane fusion protein, copper/silver efflux system